MEVMVTGRFHCPDEDAPQWEEIFSGLTNHEWGADFQDRIDYFGSAAAEQLETMLDDFDPSYWACEWWGTIESGVEFHLNCGTQAENFAESLEELLKLCRATVIEIDMHYDEDE